MKQRGFEIAKGYEEEGIVLPVRKTKGSAAYDICSACDVVIPPYQPGMKPTLIPTGLKVYCREDECILLLNRSSGPKKGFFMSNGIGLIDADYYENKNNDGHFYLQYYNWNTEDLVIKKGDVIGQALFVSYLKTDNDYVIDERTGGFGSTDK